MSGAVDDEVVRMRLENSAFSRGVSNTISMLSRLKSSLSFTGAGKGLDDIANKANHFDMSGVNKQIEDSKGHWSAWRTAGLIAFATVVHRAVSAGINIVKAFTLDPVMAGFHNYETQINAVQTILANTGLKGKAGLEQVNGALNNLNTYANKTVYNFSEMAKNIGTFTAAGVKLQPATDAIKGIANLAALSGSNSQQASTAMYQLSQAIAANKVGLQDWNSVVNAGMGGKVFQNALFNVGKMQHTLKGVKANETFDQWTKSGNSFRQSLQSGWITGKVLTQTLAQFTGDLTDAQLKAQGYNKTQIAQIQELAKTAVGAATHIKTLTQLQDALKEEVATAYGAIFKTIFGDINGATTLFTGLHTVLENALTVPIYSLNTLLQKVTELGGRAKAIDAFKNVFKAFGAILKPIGYAFREVFPAKTAAQVASMVTTFDNFTKKLIISKDSAARLQDAFSGVFAVFDIGKQIVGGLIHIVVDLVSSLLHGSGGILAFAGNIGYTVEQFDEALKKGDALGTFFDHIGAILAVPIQMLSDFAHWIGSMFSGFHGADVRGVTGGLDAVNDRLSVVQNALEHFRKSFDGLGSKLKPAIDTVAHLFGELGHAIANGLNSQAFGNILKTIQVGLLGGIVVLLKKFLSGGIHVDVGGGIFGKAGEVLEGLTGKMKAMQTELKAKSLLEIAGAIGILTVSVIALSGVNAAKLATALKAMAVGFGELLGSFVVLSKVSGAMGQIRMPLMAATLNLLATSMVILAAAVRILASMSWAELEKGLTAVGILLAEISAATAVMSRNATGMVTAGVGITAIAVALNIMAIAVKQFAAMNWKDLGKGLLGVAGALVAIAAGLKLMPTESMISTGIGLLAIGVALNAVYFAVKSFSSLNWKQMAKGLVGVAGALGGIALAMQIMPKGMILQAAGLAAIAGSLILIEKVMLGMAKMSWGAIAKGIGSIAIALGVLAIALTVMDGTLPGAAALAVAAASLSLLLPAIEGLGKQSWGAIVKGLVEFAAALVLLIAGAAVATAVIPGLIALGVASLAIGAGLALAGAGLGALAAGLSLLAATGSAGVAVLAQAIVMVIKQIPALAVAVAKAVVQVLQIIGSNGPAIVAAFSKILAALLTAVIKNAPLLAKAFRALIDAALNVVVAEAPKIVKAGLSILMDLLTGIKNNIGRVTRTAVDIIVRFINTLANNIGRIINAGVNLLTKLLIGIANALGKMPSIGLRVVIAFVNSLINNNGRVIAQGVAMVGHVVSGIGRVIGRLTSQGAAAAGRFISGLASKATSAAIAGINLLNKVLTGIGDAIRDSLGWIADKAGAIGKKIVDAIIDGIGNLAGALVDKLKGAIGGALSSAKNFITHLGGPACTIGQPIMELAAQGITDNADKLTNSITTHVGKALDETSKRINEQLYESADFRPTITPVLDLSSVQKDAGKISGLMGAEAITATASYASAADISAQQLAALEAAFETPPPPVTPPSITFQQNNTSPKALTTVEIYRQTNNLISQARSALKVPIPQPTS